MPNAIDIVDQDSLLGYASKYNIPLDYAQTIYNMLYLDNPKLVNDQFQFRMPRSEAEVKNGNRTGSLIQVGVANYITDGKGNVTWIGIEGVNIDRCDTAQDRRSSGRSKLDICRQVFDAQASRKDNIQLMIEHAGCTSAGAATYYAKLKREIR